jgi:hypothetical protein
LKVGSVGFLIIIFHFFKGKATINAQRLCKLRKYGLTGIVAAFPIKDLPHLSTTFISANQKQGGALKL